MPDMGYANAGEVKMGREKSEAVRKYDELMQQPQFKSDGFHLQVMAPWYTTIELSIGFDHGGMGKVGGFSNTRLFLDPDKVDILIERLLIAKNVVLEKQAEQITNKEAKNEN